MFTVIAQRAFTVIRQLLIACLFIIFLSSLAGSILGYPVGLTYTGTGSMEPTIGAGDGYISVPSALAGTSSTGDVVIFDAAEINRGGLVVHRIVEETEEGYITKGDANAFTDQSKEEPVVTDDQITGVALSSGNDVLTIPHFGSAVQTIKQLISLVQRQLVILFESLSPLERQYLVVLSFITLVIGIVHHIQFDNLRD